MKLFPKIPPPARACAAMTLIEMMVSIGIGVLIMGVAIALIIFSGNTFLALSNYDDISRKSRNALDLLSADIRASQALMTYVSNSTVQQLVFTNMPGAAAATVTYSYDNTAGTLTRTLANQSASVVLSNITSLTFELSSRSPGTNFTFNPTGTAASAKLIDVYWLVSRPVYGSRLIDSDSVQNARIVVRN